MKDKEPKSAQLNTEILEIATREAKSMGHESVSSGHILLALLQVKSETRRLLTKEGVTPKKVRDKIRLLYGWTGIYPPTPEVSLTEVARLTLRESSDRARTDRQNYFLPEHILGTILDRKEGLAVDVLRDLKVDIERLRRKTAKILKREKKIA